MQTLSSAQVLYLLEIMIADQINEFQCFNIFFVLSFKFYMSHLNSLNTQKTTAYDVGNLGPGLRLAQKCGVVKLVG
jgi:hypothetical protein